MEHFIFTRFSLRMRKAVDRSNQDSWLRERVRIFEQFALPSLRGQTCSNFRWLIMVSPETPQWVWERSQNWQPAELATFENTKETATFLNREAQSDQILCSRIDSDDAVSETYVAELQAAARSDQEWLVFANGVVWGNQRCCEWQNHKLNAFPTLVDQRPFVGPFCVQHTALRNYAPVRCISTQPGWLIHVHQNNILNSARLFSKGKRLSPTETAKRFHIRQGVEQPMKRVELINTLIEQKGFRKYLEIGCAKDKTFNRIQAAYKVGVDPKSGGTIRKTSDQFFAESEEKFDIIFIDGLHHWDQVFKDVEHSLAVLNSGGAIILHDCLPTEEFHQRRTPSAKSGAWTGDVWKAIVKLRTRTDVDVAVLNSDWGLGMILARTNSAPLELDEDIEDLDWNWFQSHSQNALRVIDNAGAFLSLSET